MNSNPGVGAGADVLREGCLQAAGLDGAVEPDTSVGKGRKKENR